jgi:hypothetical protein
MELDLETKDRAPNLMCPVSPFDWFVFASLRLEYAGLTRSTLYSLNHHIRLRRNSWTDKGLGDCLRTGSSACLPPDLRQVFSSVEPNSHRRTAVLLHVCWCDENLAVLHSSLFEVLLSRRSTLRTQAHPHVRPLLLGIIATILLYFPVSLDTHLVSHPG